MGHAARGRGKFLPKLAADMREIWQMQPRFERRTASSAQSLASQARFRAGYDFLRLRADVGEVDADLADWWEDYHLGSSEEREALVLALRESTGQRRTPAARRAPADPSVETADGGGGEADEDAEGTEEAGEAMAAPAKRRRRRRRKPAAENGAPAPSPAD
jgi:poly(A) polymerase